MDRRVRIFIAILILSFIFTLCLKLLTSVHCVKQPWVQTKPNIIIILTDQERYPTHWPANFVSQHLPSHSKLKRHGLTFTRAYTSASECSPSRAVMLTSQYYPNNQVPTTAPLNNLPPGSQMPSIGTVLASQGYEVVYKGKWHLSNPSNGPHWTEPDIANMQSQYGWARWNPPDAGGTLDLFTLGGGEFNNDSRIVRGRTSPLQTYGWGESVQDYIHYRCHNNRQPFCLFISLVNPHDIWLYPGPSTGEQWWHNAGYRREDFIKMGIDLPPNRADNLSTKPSIQTAYRNLLDSVFPLPARQSEFDYINFYAYLHTVVDKQISHVLHLLDKHHLTGSSVILRTADHGEMGLSHGLRQKAYSMYEEMIHVPFIVSNPNLFPSHKTTDAFYHHLDLLPTIADLAGITSDGPYGFGQSIVPVIKNPATSVQDSILFAYDDVIPLMNASMPGSHLRAIRSGPWAYAVYFAPSSSVFEYEMYNLDSDPGQLTNLLFGSPSVQVQSQASTLHNALYQKLFQTQALPPNVNWPSNPWATTTSLPTGSSTPQSRPALTAAVRSPTSVSIPSNLSTPQYPLS